MNYWSILLELRIEGQIGETHMSLWLTKGDENSNNQAPNLK